MRTRRLGTAGPKLSVIGLGGNNFGWRSTRRNRGGGRCRTRRRITHFDTAEMYGEGQSEEFLGAALGPA